MLFLIAIASSILSTSMMITVDSLRFRANFFSIDSCVNLWCIYLQFSFANNHLKRCCGCCDEKCRDFTSRRTRKMIHELALSVETSTNKSTSDGGRSGEDNVQNT